MYFVIFFATIILIESIYIFKTGLLGYQLYGEFDIGIYKYPVAIIFFIFSMYCFKIAYQIYKRDKNKQKAKKIIYSICPNCKETFTYEDLENGKCIHCKDVDTIDIEEYYKKYSD